MALLNYKTLLTEFLVDLRKNITDPSSRGSNAVQTFSGDGSTTQFTPTNTNVKHISSITVDSVAQTEFRDFTVEYFGANKGRITFTTAPASGTNNISVTYHYGDTWVFPEYPNKGTNIGDLPRVSVEMTSRSKEISLGGTTLNTDLLIQVTVFCKDSTQLGDLINNIRTHYINNKKNFVQVPFVTVDSVADIEVPEMDFKAVAKMITLMTIGVTEY